jgi:type I pantothenate kinase
VDPYQLLATEVDARLPCPRPVLLGIAGGVGVGKSTLAEGLRARLVDASVPAEVVATDAFLFPNDELERREMTMRKGFPESFDVTALEAFLAAARAGEALLRVPLYSHATYDRVPGGERVLAPADVVIIEGVNALLPPVVEHLDVAVYLDASQEDMQTWFVDRFLAFCAAARDDEGSFYRGFAGMPVEQQREIAEWTFREINLVNLRDHIAPTKANATVVLSKRSDHSVRDVATG